jgi:hypothetical protein
MDRAGLSAEALDAGRSGMRSVPSLALAYCLAPRLAAAGQLDEAAKNLLTTAAMPESLAADQWGLLHAAADFLTAQHRLPDALAVYKRLLSIEAIPSGARASWLVDGENAATAAGDSSQANAWKAEIAGAVNKILSGG